MNERIKQLAEQAGLSEGRFERYEGQDCDLKGYSMLPEQMAKFAELIIRECAERIITDTHLEYDDAVVVSNYIKQHFGVEL